MSDGTATEATVSGRDNRIWSALALSLPLLAVDFLRLDINSWHIHIAVPMAIMGLILAFAIWQWASRGTQGDPLFHDRLLSVCVAVFLTCHLMGLFRAADIRLAVRECVKLVLGVASLWAIAVSFPRKDEEVERFWKIALWATTVLFGYLIYLYYFKFQGPYLSSDIHQLDRGGRNHLTQYLVYLAPLGMAWLLIGGGRLREVVAVVAATSLAYAGSRSAIISVMVGMLYFLWHAWVTRSARRAGWWLVKGAQVTAFILLPALVVLRVVPGLETKRKFIYLLQPQAVPELNSYKDRGERMQKGVEVFFTNPIFGVGLTNLATRGGVEAHSDYFNVIAEEGVVGLLAFLGILFAIARRLYRGPASRRATLGWTSVGIRMAFPAFLVSIFFIDTYTTPMVWIFLGLCLVRAGMDESAAQLEARLA
jgi:hypothetical protein